MTNREKQTYNPCDDCQYSYSKNNQESGMCKTCEFPYFRDRQQSEGEWLPSPDGINPIICNKCNTPAPFAFLEDEFGDTGFHRYPWHYCPYCGAKMKVKE